MSARTRGQVAVNQNLTRKAQAVIRIYNRVKRMKKNPRGGAILLDAHGSLGAATNRSASKFAVVPDNTVVIFLSRFGMCASMTHLRAFENKYFTSEAGIKRFLSGHAASLGEHFGNAGLRTYLPGQEYPNANLEFFDSNYKDLGYAWKLPKPVSHELVLEHKNLIKAPQAQDVYTSIGHSPHAKYFLDNVIRILGPGVYIVSSCLIPYNQLRNTNLAFNAPRNTGHYAPPRMTKNAAPYKKLIFGGTTASRARTRYVAAKSRVQQMKRKLQPVRTSEILARLGRKPTINLFTVFPQMATNANRSAIQRVKEVLTNPAKRVVGWNANQNSIARLNSLPWNKKGQYVYNALKNNNRRNYYVQITLPNRSIEWRNMYNGRKLNNKPNGIVPVNINNSNNRWMQFFGALNNVGNSSNYTSNATKYNVYRTP